MIMERLNFLNNWYILSLVLLIVIPLVLYFILKRKSDKTIKYTLVGMAIANFLLHFLKFFHPTYISDINNALIKISLENICAVTTVILPFAMNCKNKTIKGYFYLIAFLGGIMAVILTTEPNGRYIFDFESIRYYFCHYVLFTVPILAVTLKEFTPDFKSSLWMPLMFFTGQFIILLNEVFLGLVGLVDYTPELFLSGDFRNPSFVFGPNLEFKSMVDSVGFLIPEIFKTNIFGISGVGDFYWPIIWLLIPVVIFFPGVYFLLTLPFTYKDVLEFIHKKEKNEKQIS